MHDRSLETLPDTIATPTMSRIRQLSSHVVNKIAAGEVIERPASVVKELLENSVDALATRIEVDVQEGGTELIRVVDDGEGIHPDDLPLAVSCHATSKIIEADDLFRVQTLGFRGEALASIAEVSRFRIRSRPADCEMGTELEVDAGIRGPLRPCGCPAGTTIELSQLFANTPVRRKFLKATSTELGHISEQFTRVALAHPRLHMVLRHNGKLVYELPATDQLLERITLFFGGDMAKNLIPVESESDGTRVWGYVGHPSQSKATRKGQYLFLNGRWIQDRSLQHALTEGYRGLLMVGRNPVTFLFLEMSPDLVDVNVHPTKAEVRFRESQKLYRQLLSTLRTRFLGMDLDSVLRVPGSGGGASSGGLNLTPAPRAVDPARQLQLQQELVGWANDQALRWGAPSPTAPRPDAIPDRPTFGQEIVSTDSDLDFGTGKLGTGELDAGTIVRITPDTKLDAHFPGDSPWGVPIPATDVAAAPAWEGTAPVEETTTPFPVAPQTGPSPEAISASSGPVVAGSVRAMQIHDSYLVLETEEGLTVVDQHALHERILYEQFRRRVLGGGIESQRLLIPEPIELSASEVSLLNEHVEVLGQLGLSVAAFGGNTVLVSGYPVMLSKSDPAQIVRDVVEQLAASGHNLSRRDLLDSLLHMMSCKAAIKAGQRLTPEEIESLLVQRHLVDDAHHCPHGRPTALLLSRAELDRQFGRMG